jgi:hypothetical protein
VGAVTRKYDAARQKGGDNFKKSDFTQSLLSRYTQSGACGFFGFSADPFETFFAAAVNSAANVAELTAAAKNVSKESAEKPHAPLWV